MALSIVSLWSTQWKKMVPFEITVPEHEFFSQALISLYVIVMRNLGNGTAVVFSVLFVMLGSALCEATNRELAANTATGIKEKKRGKS